MGDRNAPLTGTPGGLHLRPWWSLHARDLGVLSVCVCVCCVVVWASSRCSSHDLVSVRHALYVTDAWRASDAGGVRGGEPRVIDRMIPSFHLYLATWSQLRGSTLVTLLSVCLLPSLIGQDQPIVLDMSHRVNDVPSQLDMEAFDCKSSGPAWRAWKRTAIRIL